MWALVLMFPLPAIAWNAAGHRLVACIAWNHLDSPSRLEIGRLLREHPDYGRWLKRNKDEDINKGVFIESSTWPDDIRRDTRFYSTGADDATTTLPGFPDMERRRNWHYVNRPLGDKPLNSPPAAEAVSGLLDKQLVELTRTLGSAAASDNERRYALPWLIHLLGDAHHPLHTSIRLNAEGQWDKLGNGLTVINPLNPRKISSTLHAFWDDLPGPPWLRGEPLDTACRALSALYPQPKPASSAEWIDESWQLASDSAYPPGQGNEITISPGFYENAREIAKRRVTQAGYRLADLLRELLSRK